MKKTTLFVALAVASSAAFAQDLVNSKGEKYLPEAGDWAISVNAAPFLQYVGQFLSAGPNPAPGFNYITNNQTIVGKMFIDATSAYRGIVRIGYTSQSVTDQIIEANTTNTYPASPTMVNDKMSMHNMNVALGAGKEWRRGHGRLQGYYGADAMLGISSSGSSYTYGNALSTGATGVPVNTTYTTNFGSNIIGVTDPYGNAARVLSSGNPMTFSFGVRGFIGAEYFIIPKISIGGEFGWGLGFTSTGKTETKVEGIGGATPAVNTFDTKSGGGFKFWADTDSNNPLWGIAGQLKMTLHF